MPSHKSETNTKNAVDNTRSFIKSLGDLALSGIYKAVDKKNPNIRKLSIPILVDSMIRTALQLNGDADKEHNNMSFTKAERAKIDTFISSFKNTVTCFMDFLDYDNDHQINLITLKQDGTIEPGKDIKAFESDMKDIGSPFKSGASDPKSNMQQQVFASLSKIFVYLTGERFKETKEDVENFTEAIKTTYTDLQNLKGINYRNVFISRVDDMVSFIIMFCVVLMPIIDLANTKLAAINEVANGLSAEGAGSSNDHIIITNAEIKAAIQTTYGNNLDYVLNLVNQLTAQLVKTFKAGKCCTK